MSKQRLTCNSAAPQWSLAAPEKMQCFQGSTFASALFFISVTWRASALAEAQCINGWGCDRVDEQTGLTIVPFDAFVTLCLVLLLPEMENLTSDGRSKNLIPSHFLR